MDEDSFPIPPNLPDVPQELMLTLEALRNDFLTEKSFLKCVTDRFVDELKKGLTEEGGDIPMNITWVTGFPTGQEQGRYLTLDLGGTNLRVCEVGLSTERGDFETTQRKYTLPSHLRSAPASELWDYAAECVRLFLHEHHQGGQNPEKVPLAFTFSYPVEQTSIKSGFLQYWTKGFKCPHAEGKDVVCELEKALEKKAVPVRIVALVNDTTGTLIASAYKDPEVMIGSICSTGCNAAYMEDCNAVPKFKNIKFPPGCSVAINTEYGAFDNCRKVLRRTRFDFDIDDASARPRQQAYEKMVAGLYLGEIVRRMLLELHHDHNLFSGQDVAMLRESHILDASFLSIVEEDDSEMRENIGNQMKEKLNLDTTPAEREICRYFVELVGTRSARLYACGIAAICKKRGIQEGKVGVDGAVFHYYKRFRIRASQALRDIMDWPDGCKDPITFQMSEDGSGVGAALIAALAMENRVDRVHGIPDGVTDGEQ